MIKGIHAKYPIVLAPLAGWSDAPFRRICKRFGVDMVYTEMVSADGAIREQKKTLALAEFSDNERPIAIQVFGAEPDTMAGAVEIIASMRPDYIDINFGCPARKIVKRGAGAALMRDLRLMEDVARAAVKATHLPISAKLRSGWEKASINVVEASQRLQDVGVQMLAIHPRTQTQQFKGQSDWSLIGEVKKNVIIPVIGNGDVTTAFDAERMFNETGCDAVMVGRAACGNPWIFQQIKDVIEFKTTPGEPSIVDRLEMCLTHFHLSVAVFGPERAAHMMKKQIAAYVKGMPGASDLRQKIFKLDSHQDITHALQEHIQLYSQINKAVDKKMANSPINCSL